MKILRDGVSVKFTTGGVGNVESRGNATIPYIEGGVDTIPSIGDALTGFPCESATEYGYIKVTDIEIQPYGFDHSGTTERYKYVVSYDSGDEVNANNTYSDFSANLSVVSMEDPNTWKYTGLLDNLNPPVASGSLIGNVKQRISRVITTGSFKITKQVDASQINFFWLDYLNIAGKLNGEAFSIIGDSGSNSIEFTQGQVLCGALDDGGKDEFGTYLFKVTFQYKLIQQVNAEGDAIADHDWQYVLAPTVSEAGWMIPIQTVKGNATTATAKPYLYEYAADDKFAYFLSENYSTAI